MVEIIIIKMNDQSNSDMIPQKNTIESSKTDILWWNIANRPSINEYSPTLSGSKVKEIMQFMDISIFYSREK